MKKLLSAADPSRALLWMRQAGVLTEVLPESEKWGIDAIHALVAAEKDLGWTPDPLLRLAAIVPPDAARVMALAERLRLSNAQAERLRVWASTDPVASNTSEAELAKKLYRGDRQGFSDRLRLSLASARGKAVDDNQALVEAGGYSRLLSFAEKWRKQEFPVKGADLTELGLKQGKELGGVLKKLETLWIESGFTLSRSALLERAAEILKA